MRLPFALMSTLALAACTSTGATGPQPLPPMPVRMVVGQSLALPDRSTLRYVGTRDDSRCPPNVTCVWAGKATVLFDHAPAGASVTRAQATLPETPTTTVGGWQVTVEALAHGETPIATVRVAAL